ncbi:hypothetical protein CTAYLR_001436 [Chrysophaeum taylorii]|uniref:Uncharacterized protein n=1 Tax=Chrysophaeum taylorii TaxID=2483200 RepID=A0AAD7XLI9_9STRA|nr:hypothetical protein CTAYLR_001436 [Chrysophaeum taylorii]
MILVLAALLGVRAFNTAPVRSSRLVVSMGYVPDGLSKAQWEKLKKDEAAKRAKKEFGKGGTRGFESRSMMSFVAALEKGEAKHLMPVDPSKVRAGKIALKDVPYMQRGGSWDNSDLKGKKGWQTTGFGMKAFNDGKAKDMKKNKYDDKYNKLKPSTNIWGTQVGADWTGKAAIEADKRAKKNGITRDQQMWRDAGALSPEQARRLGKSPKLNQEPKKFFGLF